MSDAEVKRNLDRIKELAELMEKQRLELEERAEKLRVMLPGLLKRYEADYIAGKITKEKYFEIAYLLTGDNKYKR